MAARASLALALCAVLALWTTAAAARGAPKKRPVTGASYRTLVSKWHEKDPQARAPLDSHGRPKLVLNSINLRERVELEAKTADGEFSEADQKRAARVLRDSSRDREHPIDPALLDLLYKLQLHFDAPEIRIISGYRMPHGPRASQHALGHASDIVVPGAEDRAVAAYARTLGTTGVGLYPTSGFVHVDVRGSSHYWIDASGPGQHAKSKPPKRVASKTNGKHKYNYKAKAKAKPKPSRAPQKSAQTRAK